MVRYLGFHEERALPIKRGDEIIVPKGVSVRSMGSRGTYVTKRSQKVRIHHTLPGQSIPVVAVEKHKRILYPLGDTVFEHYDALIVQYAHASDPEVRSALHTEMRFLDVPVSNPSIVWAGTGGYWCDVDINDVLAANGIS